MILVAAFGFACTPAEKAAEPEVKKEAPANADAVEAKVGDATAEKDGEEGKAPCDKDTHPGMGKIEFPEATLLKAKDGTELAHWGAPFKEIPEVKVSEILANPDKWTGKEVKILGNVSAMCNHRRGWFALAAEDDSGKNLRIWAMPKFLVPAGTVGKKAVAQGVVEVREVEVKLVQHLAKEHKLDDTEQKEGKVKRVMIIGTGAEFI